MISNLQSLVRPDVSIPEPKEEKWSDFVDDLWDRKLPHFRRKGYVYSSSPQPSTPGSPESSPKSSKVVNELIHYNSETSLVEIADEEIPVMEPVSPQVPSVPEPGTS